MGPSGRTTYLQGGQQAQGKGFTKISPALGIEVPLFYEIERFEPPASASRALGLLVCAESRTSHRRLGDS